MCNCILVVSEEPTIDDLSTAAAAAEQAADCTKPLYPVHNMILNVIGRLVRQQIIR